MPGSSIELGAVAGTHSSLMDQQILLIERDLDVIAKAGWVIDPGGSMVALRVAAW
jgi:hypothetical protein